MTDTLRVILPLYFAIYFGIAFVLKTVIVARRIGKNPLVLPKDDSAYGLIGTYFKITLIGIFLYTIVYSLLPTWHAHLLPVEGLDKIWIQYTGIGLLIIALIWTVIAQIHMKDSWRIGIDEQTKTELITTGLFSLSRNPIFFGMILSLAGLFLATPNGFTALFFILGYVLIQIQIRLEEEFLEKEFRDQYRHYKDTVRRLI